MRRTGENPVSNMVASFGEARADYNLGHESRFRPRLQGVQRLGSGADYHYRNEAAFYLGIEQAREFDRNDPIVGMGITRNIRNVMQTGFVLDTQTGNKELDKRLTEKWEEFASEPSQCHSEMEFDFNSLAEKAMRAMDVDGDHVVLPLNTGFLQFIEAHRMRTPRNAKKEQNVIHGVKLNADAVRVEYWITKEDLRFTRPTQISEVDKIQVWDENGNRQALHIYDPKRTSQRRGVSVLAPIVDTVGMFGDTQFAMLVKQQVASCITILEELAVNGPSPGPQQIGNRTTQTRADGTTRTIEELVPGIRLTATPGGKLTAFSPNIPGDGYLPHAMMTLCIIAANLDVPVAVLLLDPTKTNFSGWRGAIDEARKAWRRKQDLFGSIFHQPIYKWKVRTWLEEDEKLQALALRRGVNPFGHTWNKPRWSYIEPMKDITAGALEIRTLQTSPRRSLAGRGLIHETVVDETIADNKYTIMAAKKAAQEVNKAFPNDEHPAHWMQLVALPMPDGVSIAVSTDPPAETAEPTKPETPGNE